MIHTNFPLKAKRLLLARVRTMMQAIGVSILLGAFVIPAIAQNRNAAEIRGTVRDTSGGVVQGVTVTAKNTATGQLVVGRTNASGIYDFPYVPPGPYVITFVKDGYEEEIKTNLVLTVDIVTVDANLRIGSTTNQVTVNASSAPLLQTESAALGSTLTRTMLATLPNVGDKWSNLTSITPGIQAVRINGNGTSGEAGGNGNSGAYVGWNGSEANEIDILVNGAEASTLWAHDAEWQSKPLDAISDVTIKNGPYGADSGNGTSIINIEIKGGTNQFHGSAWEIAENTIFNTKPWGIGTTQPITHYNKFGYSIGGPVIKNRLYFFQCQQWNPSTGVSSGFYTVPEDAVRGIGTPNGNAVFDPSIYGTIYDPATEQIVNGVKVRQPFPNNTIPASRFNPVSVALMNFWPEANKTYANGSNYTWVGPASTSIYKDWIYRVDFDATKRNRISTTGSMEHLPYWDPAPGVPPQGANAASYFGEGAKPYGYDTLQGTDAWSLTPVTLNELRLSYFKVDRDYYCQDYNIVKQLGLQNVPYDIFPKISITGGSRVPFNLNGCGPGGNTDHSYVVGDSFSWLKGKHELKFGGEWNWASSAYLLAPNSGNWAFNGNSTLNPNFDIATGVANPTGGSGWADFLLGDVDSWSNTISAPGLEVTDWTLQLYAQDAFKLRHNLTLTLGLRAIYQTGLKEVNGRYANFQPTLINPATNTPGAIGYGSVSLGHSMENNRWLPQPRLGASWSPWPNWVVRGGFGLYNVPWSAIGYANGVGTGYESFGSLTQPANNFEPVMLFSDPSPNLTTPTNADLTPTLLNGQSVTYLPKDIPTQYDDQYDFDVQHVIAGYLFDVAYVGTLMNNKMWQTDHTQNPASQLGSSTHPYAQYTHVTEMLRQGWGTYNGIQVQSKKNFQYGLTYQANYTFSKMLDTGSTAGQQSANGEDYYQNAYDPGANYGRSMNDMRHMFNGGATYQLPFGRGRMFMNHSIPLDEVFGGWQIAMTWQWHSGAPFTPVVGGEPFANSGLYSGQNWYANRIGSGNGNLSHPTTAAAFNVNDFAVPANNTLGNTGRNIVTGPRYSDVDMGLSKAFHLPFLGEDGSFELRCDATDLPNHHVWNPPSDAIYATPALNAANDAGAITSRGSGRTLQLEGHLRF